MKSFYFGGKAINEHYNNAGEILLNKFNLSLLSPLNIKRHYDIYELEVFKITKE